MLDHIAGPKVLTYKFSIGCIDLSPIGNCGINTVFMLNFYQRNPS